MNLEITLQEYIYQITADYTRQQNSYYLALAWN